MNNELEALAVRAVTLDVPIAFYEWLATVERDVRVHDLTPYEIVGLAAALRERNADMDDVEKGERVIAAHLEALHGKPVDEADCDPSELLGFYKEKLRQAEAQIASTREASTKFFASLPARDAANIRLGLNQAREIALRITESESEDLNRSPVYQAGIRWGGGRICDALRDLTPPDA